LRKIRAARGAAGCRAATESIKSFTGLFRGPPGGGERADAPQEGQRRGAQKYRKQMAAALQYLQENNLLEYAALEAQANAATDLYHTSADRLKATEAAMKHKAV
jgi:hypothetical protein